MRTKVLVLTFMLMMGAVAIAQDIAVDATVSSNQATLKEAVRLTVTISGTKDDVAPPDLSKLDGFDAQYIGPSTQVSIINGQYSSQRSFTYSLFPTKTGHLEVPAMVLTIGANNYTTKPIGVDIVDPSGAAKSEAETLREKIFLVLEIPNRDVRFGEKVPVSIKLFVTDLPVRNIQYPTLEKNGFTMDNLQAPQQYGQVINGVKYDVVNFRTFIYPTKIGELDLGSAKLEGNLIYKGQEGNDFFSGFFGNYQARPITVTSRSVRMNVLPLPTEGKPADFKGAVGQLEFSASVTPSEIRVGDPLTLRMRVSGVANFKSVPMPVFSDSNFKTYDPQIKDEEGAKSLEQVIIPMSDKVTEVPAITFSYFDSTLGQYKTLTQGPFALKVTAPAPGQEFKAIGFSELSQNPIHVEQVDYVQKYIKEPITWAIAFCKTLRFWLSVLFLGVLWGAWVLWSRFRERLMRDTAFARRINASKNAKQGLAQAERLLRAGDAKGFYGELHKTLSAYVRDKGLKEDSVAGLKSVYEICDLVRFAGGRVDDAQMRLHLEEARRIIAIPVK